MKKNVYLIQPTFMNGTSVHFPYAIGSLASYAWSDREICEEYDLKKVFFLRENIREVVALLETPFLIGFSNYIWNFEYNKCLAQEVKKLYPDCIIVFGGPQISPELNMLNSYSFIDILILYEGEVAFKNLLKSLARTGDLSDISNISYRESENKIITTKVETNKIDNLPSPYESGFFDRLCEEYPDVDFIPLIETNRGCPNKCSYCSWGSIESKVRFFPLERVFYDIEWISKHKMDFLGFADANFGLFPRDEVIVDKIIDCYKKNGYPKKFQVSYSKGAGERVFNITKKLNDNNMDKGVTLSFQSMSKIVQQNIGRSNMDIEYYKDLLKKYSEANIPTYTDLILGLPGETLDSFKKGIDELLEYGQHTSLFVHLCEWLPLSEMGREEYIEKYKLGITEIPLNQPHRSLSLKDDVQEYSHIITSTYSMNEQEWIKTLMFSTCVLSLHHLGLLQLVAVYLHYEKNIKYSDFYSDILEYMLSHSFKNDIFRFMLGMSERIISKNEAVVVFDEFFGDIAWPFEEIVFLKLVTEKEYFYKNIKEFLTSYEADEKLLDDLLAYQEFVVKSINNTNTYRTFMFDWKKYFDSLFTYGKKTPLNEDETSYRIIDDNPVCSWKEYAKKILWFGRRGGRNIYTTEIHKEEN